jgi:hypothetical protein
MDPARALPRLDDAQIRRYGRQILLDAIGGKGQRALLASAVRVALDEDDRERLAAAAIALVYLAGAGVGHLHLTGAVLGLVRDDELGLLLGPDELGLPRGPAIARAIAARTPDVQVHLDSAPRLDDLAPLELRLDEPPTAAAELLAGQGGRAARALWRGSAAATAAIAALLPRGGA